jgi:hypothetical protein
VSHSEDFDGRVEVTARVALTPAQDWRVDSATSLTFSWVDAPTVHVDALEVEGFRIGPFDVDLGGVLRPELQRRLDQLEPEVDGVVEELLRIPWHLRDSCPQAAPDGSPPAD